MMEYHVSVLLDAVVEQLAVRRGGMYIDATLGGGGHTAAILAAGGKVLGIDQDQEALDHVAKRMHVGEALVLAKGNFREIDSIATANGFERINGVVFDLGVSSHQFDDPDRGFSFRAAGPLDMRMDRELPVSAKDLVNGLTKNELADLFYKYGEEHQSRRIAEAIVTERAKRPIESTAELEKLIRHELGGRHMTKGKTTTLHPATKVFQALRIAINDELHSIEEALPKAVALLDDGGRVAVITFHSLEDRIVKHAFKAFERDRVGRVLTDTPIVPTDEEVARNIRARSAKLRVFEKKV